MVVGHAFSVMASRFGLVYKSLFFTVIVLLLIIAVAAGILSGVLSPIIDKVADVPLWSDVQTLVVDIVKGSPEDVQNRNYENVVADIQAIGNILEIHVASFNWSVFVLILFIVLGFFAVNLCYYPTADVLYHFMNSNSRFGFMSNFFANFKQSMKFAGVNVIIGILHGALIAAALAICWFGIGRLSVLLAISVFVILYLLLYALKSVLTQRWLPNMVVGRKKVFAALRDSIRFGFKNFGRLMSLYFAVYLVFFGLTVMLGLFTFGVGLIFMLAMQLVFLRALELVYYHNSEGLKYYTSVKSFNTEAAKED